MSIPRMIYNVAENNAGAMMRQVICMMKRFLSQTVDTLLAPARAPHPSVSRTPPSRKERNHSLRRIVPKSASNVSDPNNTVNAIPAA